MNIDFIIRNFAPLLRQFVGDDEAKKVAEYIHQAPELAAFAIARIEEMSQKIDEIHAFIFARDEAEMRGKLAHLGDINVGTNDDADAGHANGSALDASPRPECVST